MSGPERTWVCDRCEVPSVAEPGNPCWDAGHPHSVVTVEGWEVTKTKRREMAADYFVYACPVCRRQVHPGAMKCGDHWTAGPVSPPVQIPVQPVAALESSLVEALNWMEHSSSMPEAEAIAQRLRLKHWPCRYCGSKPESPDDHFPGCPEMVA